MGFGCRRVALRNFDMFLRRFGFKPFGISITIELSAVDWGTIMLFRFLEGGRWRASARRAGSRDPHGRHLCFESLERWQLLAVLASVSPATASLLGGTSQQFTAFDQSGHPITDGSVVWSTNAGTIGSNGIYTAPASGTSATVTASQNGASSQMANITNTPPLLYYKNNAISSGTNVVDSSPSGFNGTLAGSYGTSYNSMAGQFNGALLLNQSGATNGYVTLPGGFATSLQSMTNFTISGWVYLTTNTSVTWERMFDFGTGTTKYMFLTPYDSSGYVRFAITTTGNGAGAEQRLTSSTKLPVNTWSFLAVTLSGTSATLYVNGYVAATNSSMTLNPSILGATTQDWLGHSQFSGSGDPNLKGGIDDFRVYNTAASPTTILAMYSAGAAQLAVGTTSLSTLSTNGYYTADTNSCAIAVNNLWTDTASNYQYAAFYTTASEIMIARRQVGAAAWQVYDSGIADSTVSDDHDVIAIAVDSAGYLHMSWGMHNISLLYAISTAPVTDAALNSIAFTQQTAANAPTLFPDSGNDTNEVTYPQFYAIPNSSNLLFTYRNGGAGGGSGNGNQYFNVYNPSSKTFSHTFVINGIQTSVNAYLNRMVFDSVGNLLMSWTWRATANWQTNSNIMFAQSPDVGTTWYKQGGSPQYTLPIIQSGTPSTSVGQVIETIPQNSSFINQTSMTVDNSNNPLIATYLAPNWNTGTNSGDPNRQYVLYYFSDGQWRSTQVTHRTSDTAIDTGGSYVRDLGRPLVLVDKQGRVLIIGRSEDTSMGGNSSPATPGNNIVVYYCTNLASGSPTWNSLTLNTTNMGSYEPTYDQNLWQSQNILSLFFEPVGLTGQQSGPVQTLDWNEQAYFAPTVATPAAAAPSPVTGTTTTLTVLGADSGGESNLTYTWSLTGSPPAGVNYSANGTNAAKTTTATFTKAGTYNFVVTISNPMGYSTTSSVSVTVSHTPQSAAISPASSSITAGATQQFTLVGQDQFGQSYAITDPVSWQLTGPGSLGASSGLYAPPYAVASATIQAAYGAFTVNSATVTVTGEAQWNSASASTWSGGPWKDSIGGGAIAGPGNRAIAGDTVLFAAATGPTVSLNGATPALAGITFNDVVTSYTIAQGTGGNITLTAGATVAVQAGNHMIAAPLSLPGNNGFDVSAGTMLTVSYPITGAGGVTKTSGGTLVLSAANNYQGGTVASAGTLIVSNPAALPDGGSLTVGSTFPVASTVVPAATEAATAPVPIIIVTANAVSSAASPPPAQQASKKPVASSPNSVAGGKPWWAVADYLARQNSQAFSDDRAAAVDSVMVKYRTLVA
jgi:autotransporter-associated beta strand protein